MTTEEQLTEIGEKYWWELCNGFDLRTKAHFYFCRVTDDEVVAHGPGGTTVINKVNIYERADSIPATVQQAYDRFKQLQEPQ